MFIDVVTGMQEYCYPLFGHEVQSKCRGRDGLLDGTRPAEGGGHEEWGGGVRSHLLLVLCSVQNITMFVHTLNLRIWSDLWMVTCNMLCFIYTL